MTTTDRFARRPPVLLALLAVLVATAGARADYSISNNLAAASGGTEAVTGTRYLAAGFGAAGGGQLASVTLKVDGGVGATVALDLYTDDAFQPGTSLGSLTLTGSLAATPTATTWTAAGITLAADTNYWVVLRALTGTLNWSWTAAATGAGTGAGYQNTWGESDDAGASWFTYDSYPTQMDVVLVSTATVPEPGSLVLWGIALVGCGGAWGRHRRQARVRPAQSA